MTTRLIPVNGAELEVDEWGGGDPAVFIQTALTADEAQSRSPGIRALQHGYRKIVYHRRQADMRAAAPPGRPARWPVTPLTAERSGQDCRSNGPTWLGFSYSGAVALRLRRGLAGAVSGP